ncbi:MAG: serine protease, partial [Chloroflexota bacterium]|nr:serine protease [Chloroflexota bacterium]
MLEGAHTGNDILPIFITTKPDTVDPARFRGMGFLIAPNILITCWHCICDPLEKGQQYAAVVKEGESYTTHILLNAEQHPLGLDIALAQVDLAPELGLTLGIRELSPGDSIFTYGYPLPGSPPTGDARPKSPLTVRFLRGYVTRSLYHNQAGFVRTPCYELDLPTTYGLCGAPIIKSRTREVAGVIFGSLELPQIILSPEPGSSVKNKQIGTGQAISFGLAHYTDSLWSLRGTVTQGKPLREFLELAVSMEKPDKERIERPIDLWPLPAKPRETTPRAHSRNDEGILDLESLDTLPEEKPSSIWAEAISVGKQARDASASILS